MEADDGVAGLQFVRDWDILILPQLTLTHLDL